MLRRFRKNQSGASAVEYACLVAALALGLAVGFQKVGNGINFLFGDSESKLRAIFPGEPPGD